MLTFPALRCCLGFLLWFVAFAGAPLDAQTYRPLDTGRNAVTLPSAEGLPSITAIAAAPGSGFSILHAREGNIHHFDADGRLLRRLGRASDAPAEFPRPHLHGWHGQAPWLFDLNKKRVTVLDGGTGRVSAHIDLPPHGPMMVHAISPSGAPVVFGSFQVRNGSGPTFRTGYALLPGFGIPPKGPFASLPASACWLRLGARSVSVPFCQASNGVVAPNGEWVAMVSAANDGSDGASAVRVVFLTTRGDTLAAVRVEAPIASVTPAARATVLREVVRSHLLSGEFERQFMDTLAARPEYPLATALVATNDRTVWLVQQTAEATRYIVVSTAGRVVARYRTAADLQVMAVAGRTAFGVRALSNGRQQVVRMGF